MKTICAWCGSPISTNCDHCGAPLLTTQITGSTFGFGTQDAMVCLNGLTPVVYTGDAIDRMTVSHGMCARCLNLKEDERSQLVHARRQLDAGLPSAADLERIVAKRENVESHEQETRRANRSEKRGPTGVSRPPTPTRKTDTGKSGAS